MLRKLWLAGAMLVLVPLAACSSGEGGDGSAETAEKTDSAPAAKSSEPDYITVQHILIAFEGSVPGKPVTRSKEEAAALAAEVYDKAKAGEDFDQLVVEYTDDSAPGKYKMANFNVEADMGQRVFARARMVKAFGDVGFPMEVGGIGMAEYDPVESQYGWHIIKRVE